MFTSCYFVGIEGGFDNNEVEYEETHSIVILPDHVSLPFPSVELPEKVPITYLLLFFPCYSSLFIIKSEVGLQ